MVVFDPASASCSVYEIKHSDVPAREQYRHLKDVRKCRDTEFRYGPITGKFVIYRGEKRVVDGLQYLNVEEYLKGL